MGPGWRDVPRLAIFLGDDSGGSASCPLLELGHLQSDGDQGSQHDLRETQTEEPFPSLLSTDPWSVTPTTYSRAPRYPKLF